MTYVNWALTSNAMGKKETNFKQTDIGLIPHDWEVATIGDGFKFITNNTLSRGQLTNKGSVLNVHYGDVHVRFSEVLDLEKSTLPFINTGIRRNAKPYLIDGDIVMADTAEDETVGKSCEIQNIGEWKVEAGLHTFALRPTQKYAPKFLGYFINSKSFHSQLLPLIQGTKVYSVTKGDLKGTAVLTPPIEEQKRIAEVLSHFDEHIDNLVALLEKRKQVKAATMHALLSGSTRLPGFTAPWINKYLREITSVTRGEILVSSDFKNGPIPVIGGGTTIAGFHNKANREGKTITISASGANAGYVSFYTMPIFASDCCTLSEGEVYDIEYLYQYLRSVQNDIYRMQTGGAQPHIYPKDIESLWISMPASVTEQSAIASVLSNMDRGIEALKQEIKKYRQMKEGAMEELLTGKVRLL